MSVLANEEKEVYSAYGMTVYCVENENIWLKNHDTVYTAIRIEKAGEDIVDIGLDINYIDKRNFEKSIDLFKKPTWRPRPKTPGPKPYK